MYSLWNEIIAVVHQSCKVAFLKWDSSYLNVFIGFNKYLWILIHQAL